MFEIRREQTDAMILHDEGRFIDFVVRFLRKESADLVQGIPDDLLREMVKHGLDRGRGHGLRTPGDLCAFVSLMFEVAPNFDEQHAIRRALRDPAIPHDRRIDRLWSAVPDTAWDEAARAYDESAWFPESAEEGEDPHG